LIEAYDKKLRVDARFELEKRVRMVVGKKDGLITVEVEDENPTRAAEIANQFVAELRTLTSTLSVTEAQQRRAFFERELKRARDGLTQAQTALQSSGFSQGALKAEPKIAADSYARMRAQVVAAEVRLQTLQSQLADRSPEVKEQQSLLNALRTELARSERASDQSGGPDYISKYREFKYQETLFDLFARQYEVARVDESREGALIQVVDVATVPEKKSRPKRLLLSGSAALLTLLALAGVLVMRQARRLRGAALAAPGRALA
jgi:capsule polysaccharide export protein KpsE/RkpR